MAISTSANKADSLTVRGQGHYVVRLTALQLLGLRFNITHLSNRCTTLRSTSVLSVSLRLLRVHARTPTPPRSFLMGHARCWCDHNSSINRLSAHHKKQMFLVHFGCFQTGRFGSTCWRSSPIHWICLTLPREHAVRWIKPPGRRHSYNSCLFPKRKFIPFSRRVPHKNKQWSVWP